MALKDVGQKVKFFFKNLFKKKEKKATDPSETAPKWFRWVTVLSMWLVGLFAGWLVRFIYKSKWSTLIK